MSITLPGVQATVVEQAAMKSSGSHFGVDSSKVSVTATETRRLFAGPRRLAGTWSIDYEFHASPTEAAAVTAKVNAAVSNPSTFEAAFKTVFKAALVEAGVPEAAANSMAVTSLGVQDAGSSTSPKPRTTTMEPVDRSSGAYQAAASMVVITTLKILFWGM